MGFPSRDTPGEAPLIGGGWGTLNNNLIKAGRCLPGGSSLAREARHSLEGKVIGTACVS